MSNSAYTHPSNGNEPIKRSAMAALGKIPHPMRSLWNELSGKDRRFLCRLAAISDTNETSEMGSKPILEYSKSWDELTEHSRWMLEGAMRRLTAWGERLRAGGASCN